MYIQEMELVFGQGDTPLLDLIRKAITENKGPDIFEISIKLLEKRKVKGTSIHTEQKTINSVVTSIREEVDAVEIGCRFVQELFKPAVKHIITLE